MHLVTPQYGTGSTMATFHFMHQNCGISPFKRDLLVFSLYVEEIMISYNIESWKTFPAKKVQNLEVFNEMVKTLI